MTQMKQVPAPDLSEVLDSAKQDLLYRMNCVNVGIIQSFDAAKQTVSVRIAIKRIQSITPDNTRIFSEHPVLLECPVFFPCGGGHTLTFPIAVGDECIVLFSDREIDNWMISGGVQPPSTMRAHDISDAIALVGIRSNPRALGSVSSTTTQLRSDNGQTFVEVNGSGEIVTIKAPEKVVIDTPLVEVTGIINIQNENSETNSCTINGTLTTNGDVIGDVNASAISLLHHVHSGVQSGISNTGEPV